MVFDIHYLDLFKVHVVTTKGVMTGRDFVVMAKALLDCDDWAEGNNVLFDHRKLDFSNTSLDDLQEIRLFHKANGEKIGKGKSAIVLEQGFLTKWVTLWSQGSRIQTGNSLEIFEDYDQALSWTKRKDSK